MEEGGDAGRVEWPRIGRCAFAALLHERTAGRESALGGGAALHVPVAGRISVQQELEAAAACLLQRAKQVDT